MARSRSVRIAVSKSEFAAVSFLKTGTFRVYRLLNIAEICFFASNRI